MDELLEQVGLGRAALDDADGMVPASLCSGVGMQSVSKTVLLAVTCPIRADSIGLICIHMSTVMVLCSRAALGFRHG